MKLKERAKQLKIDIPGVFLSLKSKDTSLLAKIIAGIWVFVIWTIIKGVFF